jgi:membrane protein DedA with SNARE-associated domain
VYELLTHLLSDSQGFFAYAMVFGVLVACGLGVPLPEDISLILGGFLAHKGAASLPVMMFVGFAGILVGDSLIFLAGRRLGGKLGRNAGASGGFFARIVTAEKRARVEGLFAKHGEKIVCIARFMPGVRAVTYFTAGSVGMSYWRFIFWDGLAALLSAPVFVWLGYRFGGQLDSFIARFHEFQYVVLGVLAVGGLGYFLWRRKKLAAQRASAAGASESDPVAAPARMHELVSSQPRNSVTGKGEPLFEAASASSTTPEKLTASESVRELRKT